MNHLSSNDTSTALIDGVNYQIRLLNTTTAIQTFEQISKTLLPSIGSAIDGFTNENMFESEQTLATAAMLLTRQLTEINVVEIIQKIFEGLTAEGVPVDFDTYFKGRLDLLVKVLTFAMKENYGSLFTMTGMSDTFKQFTKEFLAKTQKAQHSGEQNSSLSEGDNQA